MLQYVRPETCQSVRPGRIAALMKFGVPEPQARFLCYVLVFSGVFLEQQYRAFTGLVHGRKTQAFLTDLVDRGYARAITRRLANPTTATGDRPHLGALSNG